MGLDLKYYCEIEEWLGTGWRTHQAVFKSDDEAVRAFLAVHSRRVMRIYSVEFRTVFNKYRKQPERIPHQVVIYVRPEYADHPKPRDVWKPPKEPPPLLDIARVKQLTWNKRETGNERAAS